MLRNRLRMISWRVMKNITKWNTTGHSAIRSLGRFDCLELLQKVVLHPHRQRQQGRGEHGGFQYAFERDFSIEAKTETLRVVAELKKSDCYLMSFYWLGRPDSDQARLAELAMTKE